MEIQDAQTWLKKLIDEKILVANAVVSFLPAASEGDDMHVYDPETGNKLDTFYGLRQQSGREHDQPHFCLSDFIKPLKNGVPDDYLGLFACTAGLGAEEYCKTLEKNHDDYASIMVKALADRLAEAYAEYLHKEVRTTLWGYSTNEDLTESDLLSIKYQGIRPACGYPSQPDHTEKRTLWKLLEAEKNGIGLTEHLAMLPAASVSGLYFANPQSEYFAVGKIDQDQVCILGKHIFNLF